MSSLSQYFFRWQRRIWPNAVGHNIEPPRLMNRHLVLGKTLGVSCSVFGWGLHCNQLLLYQWVGRLGYLLSISYGSMAGTEGGLLSTLTIQSDLTPLGWLAWLVLTCSAWICQCLHVHCSADFPGSALGFVRCMPTVLDTLSSRGRLMRAADAL